MLRRIDYNDFDFIITFFTLKRGKVSAIAKYAKKSKKRFAGILELFSTLYIVCILSKGKRLYVLQEASLKHPFAGIRENMKKTAYASYFVEIVNKWVEEGKQQIRLYNLLHYVLDGLDKNVIQDEVLSLMFQVRFLTIAGLFPNLLGCSVCRVKMDSMKNSSIMFDLKKGGLVCEKCASKISDRIFLSKGTIKQLLWLNHTDLIKGSRIRFTESSIREGLNLFEVFVPYHLGIETKSLKVLQQIRRGI